MLNLSFVCSVFLLSPPPACERETMYLSFLAAVVAFSSAVFGKIIYAGVNEVSIATLLLPHLTNLSPSLPPPP